MFAVNTSHMAPCYNCGTYHKRGLKGCFSHSVRVDMLDPIIKKYIQKIRDNSSDMLSSLEESIKNEPSEVSENETTIALLEKYLKDAKEELKSIQKRKIKELTKYELELESNPSILKKIKISIDKPDFV